MEEDTIPLAALPCQHLFLDGDAHGDGRRYGDSLRTHQLRQHADRLRGQGYSFAAIAVALGVSASCIPRLLNRTS